MVTLAGLQNVVAGGGSNDGQGDGAARRAAGYKGVDSKVHPKGSYERRRVCDERERQGRKKGQERERKRKRENTGEFTFPGEFLQDLISRVHVRAHVREYARRA